MTGSLSFNGSSDYARASVIPVSVQPLTMAGWCKWTGTPAGAVHPMCICEAGVASTAGQFRCNISASTTGVFNISQTGPTATGSATTTNVSTVDTWTHCAAIFTSNTSRRAILNGDTGGAANNTTNTGTPGSLTRFSLGVRDLTAQQGFFQGLIGAWAVWNVALSDEEVVALAKGWHPTRIRRTALVWLCMFPALGTVVTDEIGTADMTITGATDSNDGPPMALR